MLQKLNIFAHCYSTGNFEELEQYLAEDCQMDSFWVFETMFGKDAIFAYLCQKGETLQKHRRCPRCTVVKLESPWNESRSSNVTVWTPEYEYGVLMEQSPTSRVLVLLKVNAVQKINHIDFCAPEMFCFSPL